MVSSPSPPQILYIQYHLFCASYRLIMNAVQLFYTIVSSHPMYLKDVTVSSGCLYAHNAVVVVVHASSSSSRCCFLSAPLAQIAVVGWQLFIVSHGINM